MVIAFSSGFFVSIILAGFLPSADIAGDPETSICMARDATLFAARARAAVAFSAPWPNIELASSPIEAISTLSLR